VHYGANGPLRKGNDRYDKHARQKESDLERFTGEGPGVDLQPSEDGIAGSNDAPDDEVDRIVDSREKADERAGISNLTLYTLWTYNHLHVFARTS
jgi:hypothetical protein